MPSGVVTLTMSETRDMHSRMSMSSTGSGGIFDGFCSSTSGESSKAMLSTLYQELEPQISKSYRPNVVYIPKPEKNDDNPPESALEQKIVSKFKTAQIVVDAVGMLSKKKNLAALMKSKKVMEASKTEPKESLGKNAQELKQPNDVSQSLPNLSNNSAS